MKWPPLDLTTVQTMVLERLDMIEQPESKRFARNHILDIVRNLVERCQRREQDIAYTTGLIRVLQEREPFSVSEEELVRLSAALRGRDDDD